MTSLSFVPAASRTETNDLKELLDVSREYVTAIRVKQVNKQTVPHYLILSS